MQLVKTIVITIVIVAILFLAEIGAGYAPENKADPIGSVLLVVTRQHALSLATLGTGLFALIVYGIVRIISPSTPRLTDPTKVVIGIVVSAGLVVLFFVATLSALFAI